MTHDSSDYFRDHQRAVDAAIETLSPAADAAGKAMVSALLAGAKVICFGNGGSSSQASHMAGELTGRFNNPRRSLPALSLSADAGTVTCISNDYGYEALYERQIEAFALPGDIALALTTSGTSANVIRGINAAKERGAVTIALTGERGLSGARADHLLAVPSGVTAHIQEIHLLLLHFWCVQIDNAFPAS